jgi:hypothetical protein
MEELNFLNKMQKDFDKGLKESLAMFDDAIKNVPEENQQTLINFKNKMMNTGKNPTVDSADNLIKELKDIFKTISNA